ncbi:MAG: hypothetical protein U0787_12680 [Polyangia bacterium]
MFASSVATGGFPLTGRLLGLAMTSFPSSYRPTTAFFWRLLRPGADVVARRRLFQKTRPRRFLDDILHSTTTVLRDDLIVVAICRQRHVVNCGHDFVRIERRATEETVGKQDQIPVGFIGRKPRSAAGSFKISSRRKEAPLPTHTSHHLGGQLNQGLVAIFPGVGDGNHHVRRAPA